MQVFTKAQVNDIALALKSGKAAILPTDTVWGIVSLNEGLIYKIKHRDQAKKVIRFIDSVDKIGLPSFFAEVLKQYWPGGLTIIWKGLSYRIPKSDYLIEIVNKTGPLYQSSANISGQDPIQSLRDVPKLFEESMESLVLVDNSPYTPLTNKPSTIINLDSMTVVRAGEINGQEIIDKLKGSK